MKKLKLFVVGLLLSLGAAVALGEQHADAALEHASKAVIHGDAGHASVLVEHATEALKHAHAAAGIVKGEAKSHIDAAIKSLEAAIEQGKKGPAHAEIATKAAEEAVKHLKAGNP